MCGIFCLLNSKIFSNTTSLNTIKYFAQIENEFKKGNNRGPENSNLEILNDNTIFGFHRLAINGLDNESNQPLCVNDCVLICNGEIYNYRHLYDIILSNPKSNSDCEIIIHMYLKFGIEQTLIMLDGVFAFALYDIKKKTLFVARDPYGVRPLYVVKNQNNNCFTFASEAKCIVNLNPSDDTRVVSQFPPGTLNTFKYEENNYWNLYSQYKYHKCNFAYNNVLFNTEMETEFLPNISKYLEDAVIKRCQTTERPIACLLSGGLDSSLITALVVKYLKQYHVQTNLETFSIGLAGATDLKYAKIVANYLGTKHTEIIVTEQEMFEAIPHVIYATETYDTTTIRASIGNFLIAKYISNHSLAKVILNGDGSDEIFGGYLYMKNCPNDIEFDIETRNLLENIHFYDVLRSDKSIASNGLEGRTPFLDKTFVNYCLSIPSRLRNYNNKHNCEKYLLRKSFSPEYFLNSDDKPLLPNEILWRTKEAFSDGVSSNSMSLFEILQTHISAHLIEQNQHKSNSCFPSNIHTEKLYYKSIFEEQFPNCNSLIPDYWMPKFINNTLNDPSARLLEHYICD
jgi:asparagine synthase (glutamine-hydrolysing)